MNRIKKLTALFAFSLLILGLPTFASAQWRDRDRDRNDDDYYENDRRDRRDRDRDDDYRNNRNRRYDRNLQATIKNLKNRSKEFAKRLDRELDRSRYDDRNREDQLNRLAESFKNAADDLDDEYDNRRDYNRSENEARRVLQLGRELDNALYRARLSYNLESDWNRIRQDLNTLSNAYGWNNNRNNRNDRNNRNGDWRNKIPFPLPF